MNFPFLMFRVGHTGAFIGVIASTWSLDNFHFFPFICCFKPNKCKQFARTKCVSNKMNKKMSISFQIIAVMNGLFQWICIFALMFVGDADAAIEPPPWSDPTKNPCANKPGGWQLLYWQPLKQCFKIYTVSARIRTFYTNRFFFVHFLHI